MCKGLKNLQGIQKLLNCLQVMKNTCRTSVYVMITTRLLQSCFWYTLLGNGHDIALNFNAHREKLLNEVVNIQSKDEEKNLKIVIHARVLGKFLFILINLTLNIFWVSKVILPVHVLDKYCKICIFILIKISLYSGYQNSYYR